MCYYISMNNYIKTVRIFLFVVITTISFGVVINNVYATDEKNKSKEQKKEHLEDKKKDVKDNLKKIQKEKERLQKKLTSHYANLSTKKRKIVQIEHQVQAKEDLIKENEKEVKKLNKEQNFQKKVLKATLRKLYYYKRTNNIEIFNTQEDKQLFSSKDDLEYLRNKIENTFKNLEHIKNSKLKKQEETLNVKEEKEKLLLMQKQQEKELKKQAINTKAQVKRADATILQLNTQLSSIESSLSALLGDSFDTDDIVKAAKFSSKKTGVRKDFILGMLTQETSLGRFTGGCVYKKSKMGSRNEKIFKRITKDLGYSYKKKKVSCPLSYGIGGAMGVSQFMPSTWVHYEDEVSKYTGHSPADPWSLTDGVMAMAIKLKRDGAVGGKDGEFNAARRYYCGARIDRKVCINYANSVLYWAKNYKRLLK